MERIYKIVLTGGCGSGKNIVADKVKKRFDKLGFHTIIMGSADDKLYVSGICEEFSVEMNTDITLDNIHSIEESVQAMSESIPIDNVLIIYSITAYEVMLSDKVKNIVRVVEMRDKYDAVFHLETLAKLDGKAYAVSVGNDGKTIEDAISEDDDLLKMWTGHPHLRIISAEESFDKKTEHLFREMENVLGVHGKVEIERRFLIERPIEEVLRGLKFCTGVDIEQSYIDDAEGKLRIRKRGENGSFIYIRTDKKRITSMVRKEKEIGLTESEYKEYLKRAKYSLKKKRYCICENGKYFELDIYPYSDEYALLEVELLSVDENFTLPSFCNVIKEVTDDSAYSNIRIAQTHKI